MKRISTFFAKKTFTVALLMLMVTFSNARIASPFGVLRVFWNKFEATSEGNNTVVLTWNVTEYNNKSFQVQHSVNGTDWEDLALVPSKNSAESMVDYTFTHSNRLRGKQFYRIQEYDVDVKSTGYSPVRTLVLETEKQTIAVWPNPATTHILITNNQNNIIYTNARIFDLAGKIMAERKLNSHSNKVAINELPPGTYIVQIESDKGVKLSQKIIKQ